MQVFAPDGLVLGLKLDKGEMFERLLEESTIRLNAGDLFVFFTDGITEAMNDRDDCFGEGRLGELVEEHADLTSTELRERILREIEAFVGSAPQHDDMTMILLRIDEAGRGADRRRERSRGDHPWLTWSSFSGPSPKSRPASCAACSKRTDVPLVVSSDLPHSIFPLAINGMSQLRISVHPEDAARARQIIESYRTSGPSERVVQLRDEFETLERAVAYRFRDRGLLEHAMTHTSRANEDISGGVTDNESMEFLGDAVLGFVIADMLFVEFPDFDEGQKSKTKASLVSTTTLARQAEQLALGDHLLLGRGEEKTGGRRKQALLADGYEALIAAIYLDGGVEHARAFIAREFADRR